MVIFALLSRPESAIEDAPENALREPVPYPLRAGLTAASRLARLDAPAGDLEDPRACTDIGEACRIGAGHPDLGAERGEFIEQRDPAARIEMGDHLVEQQQRRDAGHLGDETCMGQHETDQERLLLAGRGVPGRHVLGRIDHIEIGEMRSLQGAAGGGVAGAAVPQLLAIAILDRGRRLVAQGVLDPAVERDLGRGKSRLRGADAQLRREARQGLAAQGGDGDGEFGGLALDGIEPMGVEIAFLEQAVARAQRALQRGDAAAVASERRRARDGRRSAVVRRPGR